jgi:hypothetical protein
MDALPSTVYMPREQHRPGRILAIFIAVTLAVLAGFVAGRVTAPTGTAMRPASGFVSPAQAWDAPMITGTGPDLVEMAARSRAVRSAPLAGTGPGLVLVAVFGQIGGHSSS